MRFTDFFYFFDRIHQKFLSIQFHLKEIIYNQSYLNFIFISSLSFTNIHRTGHISTITCWDL